ncbi:hypothetical protein LCGC14_2024950, partial [marine sediment metagenome]
MPQIIHLNLDGDEAFKDLAGKMDQVIHLK